MRPWRLVHYGQRQNFIEQLGSGTDISRYVVSPEKFTNVGTGEIVSARVMLDAGYGDFVTRDNNGSTPIIRPFDLFRLEMLNPNGTVAYWRFLIQDDVLPQKNENGRFLTLELFGRERYLQKMYFPGHFYFIEFKDLVKEIIMFWNTNKGTGQPFIVTIYNDADDNDRTDPALDDFPDHTYGVFDFGDKTTVYDALMEVIKRLGLSVPAGGAGEQFGLFFSDPVNNSDSALRIHIQAQGITPHQDEIKTLGGNDTGVAIHSTEQKQPEQGNVVIVKGKPGSGSYPREPALWRSLIEEFENLPLYNSAISYSIGAYVRYRNSVYQSDVDNNTENPQTSSTFWTLRNFRYYVEHEGGGTNFEYSPWTKNKEAVFRSYGGNPGGDLASQVTRDGTAFTSLCFPDLNLVIRDSISTQGAWRDWVDFRGSVETDIPSEYGDSYHGMRVLVNGNTWNGNTHDKLNQPYAESLIMRDRDGDWIVFRVPQHNDECAIVSEGKVYAYAAPHTGQAGRRRFNRTQSTNLGWRDMSQVPNGNDCFHYPTEMSNVDGLIGKDHDSPITDADINHYKQNSAVRIKYIHGKSDVNTAVAESITSVFAGDGSSGPNVRTGRGKTLVHSEAALETQDGSDKPLTEPQRDELYKVDQYNNGWWLTLFESPSAKSTHNGQTIGNVFERPVLDLNNLNYTPSGESGYGHDDSDLLGTLDGIKLLFRFESSGFTLDWGDIPFRCVIYDLLGGTWIADKKVRFRQYTTEIDFAVSDFQVYRARRPQFRSISSGIARIINPELKITEIFERRLIKRVVLQSMIGYVDDGAYAVWDWGKFFADLASSVTFTPTEFIGMVDAFHFTKTPIVIAKDDTTQQVRHLESPVIDYPAISNVTQLQKIADAELDIATFQQDRMTFSFNGFVAVNPGDSVYVLDDSFVSESEKTGVDNTVRMIVSKVNYSVGDRQTASGMRTDIDVYRRIGVDRD